MELLLPLIPYLVAALSGMGGVIGGMWAGRKGYLSEALLTAIGNQHSTDYVRHWIESWTQWETTHPPGAAFNLLNTTESWKPDGTAYHATDFNSVGVKNYASFADGIQANAKVLRNGRYPELLHALVNNDEAALKNPNAAIQAEIDLWGTHHGLDIAALASDLANLRFAEPFPGDATPAPAPPPQVQPPQQGGSMTTLAKFPMVSERTGVTGDSHPSENAGLDCVPASICAAAMYLNGISALGGKYTPDSFKDAVYGQGVTGGEEIWKYVPYLKTLGINLISQSGPSDMLLQTVHRQIKAGNPVVFTEPNPYGNPNFTHVCVFFGEQPGFLTALDPWIAQAITHSDATWTHTLLNNEVWVMEKMTAILPDALAKAGWTLASGVLKAPAPHDTIPIPGPYCSHILTRNPSWRIDDYPLAPVQMLAPLEGSNPNMGNGTQQAFRFQYLEVKAGESHVIEVSTGQELAWTRAKLNEALGKLNALIGQVQVKPPTP